MSFGSTAASIPREKKLAGLDPTKVASTERAQPLPYFAGRARLGVTWLGKALRQKTRAIKSGGKGSTVTGYNYYCDLAGLVCHGMVDAITEVWMDDYQVWTGNVTRTTGQNSAAITVPDRGVMTLYWGTETQGIDPLLAGEGHTAYRGQCYAVFNQLALGRDTTSPPNVEFVLHRAPPTDVGALVAAPMVGDSASVPHCIAEALCNQRFGAAFDPAETLDLAELQEIAQQLADEGLGLSPKVTDQTAVRSLLTSFCEYLDGWIETTPNDLLRLRLTRENTTDFNTLPGIDENDLLDPPQVDPQSWEDTNNQVFVKFTNAQEGYQDDSAPWNDLANLAFAGLPRPAYLDRPWIDNIGMARLVAAINGRVLSSPTLTGKFNVRKEATSGLMLGSYFRFSYADFGTSTLMRVTKIGMDQDRSQAVSLEAEADRYFDNVVPYRPDIPTVGDVPPVAAEPLLYGRVIELPYDLTPIGVDRSRPQLGAAGARAASLDIQLQVFSSDDGSTYHNVATTGDFALYGTLAAACAATGPLLDNGTTGLLINLAGPDTDWPSTSTEGWLTGQQLLFIGDEILSYREAVLVSATQVRLLGIRRALSDTVAAVHAIGSAVLMVARTAVCVFTDTTYAKGKEIAVKLPTANGGGQLDMSEIDAIEITLANRTAAPLPPTNLRIDDVYLAPTFTAGADVTIAWDAMSWHRNDFWANWDAPADDVALTHRLVILQADGTVVRQVIAPVGTSSYTYTAADLAADFGTATPASIKVRVFGRYPDISLQYAEQTATLAP